MNLSDTKLLPTIPLHFRNHGSQIIPAFSQTPTAQVQIFNTIQYYFNAVHVRSLYVKFTSHTFLLFFSITFYAAEAQGNTVKMITDTTRFITATGYTEKYYWKGTNQGLYMISNRTGKRTFLTQEKSQLPDNYVTSIVCCSDGQTYIGTKKGILLWDNFSFFTITTENSDLPENNVTELSLDEKDNLIVQTKTCGIFKGIGHCIKAFKLHKVEK